MSLDQLVDEIKKLSREEQEKLVDRDAAMRPCLAENKGRY